MTRSRIGDSWCGQVVAALGQEEEESHLCSQDGGWMERMVLRNKWRCAARPLSCGSYRRPRAWCSHVFSVRSPRLQSCDGQYFIVRPPGKTVSMRGCPDRVGLWTGQGGGVR